MYYSFDKQLLQLKANREFYQSLSLLRIPKLNNIRVISRAVGAIKGRGKGQATK